MDIFDPATGALRQIATRNANSLLFNPNDGSLYFLDNDFGNTLGIFRPATGVNTNVAFAFAPSNLAVDARRGLVYVTDRAAGALSVLDANRHKVLTQVPVPRFSAGSATADLRPITVSQRTGRVFLTHTETKDFQQGTAENFVDMFDPDSGRLRTVALPTGSLGYSGFLALDDARQRLYLVGRPYYTPSGAERATPTLLVRDAGTLATVAEFPIEVGDRSAGRAPVDNIAVDAGTGHVFLTRFLSPHDPRSLVVLDGTTGAPVAALTGRQIFTAIAVSAPAGAVYLLDTVVNGGRLFVVDTTSNAVITSIVVPRPPFSGSTASLVVDEKAGKIYQLDKLSLPEANGGTDTTGLLNVIDLDESRFVGQVELAQFPAAMAVDPLTSQLFVSDAGAGAVRVLSENALPSFFNDQRALSRGFYFLPTFGYYYLGFFPYVYHLDLGFLYCIDSRGDAARGAYFYDFGNARGSLGFFYTSPTLFPYLYVFDARAWFYYLPDGNQAGRFTHDPRVFFNFATGQFLFE